MLSSTASGWLSVVLFSCMEVYDDIAAKHSENNARVNEITLSHYHRFVFLSSKHILAIVGFLM